MQMTTELRNVDDVLTLSGQCWETLAFHAAVKLGVFDALVEDSRCAGLAASLQADEDGLKEPEDKSGSQTLKTNPHQRGLTRQGFGLRRFSSLGIEPV